MFDWIFAFFHLFLLAGVLGYAFYSLSQGNIFRFTLIIVCLTVYYFLVLHKAVKKEIKKKQKKHS
ncbi:MAG: hypothetical protein ACE5GI_04930 [Candidatus Aminicenantales bacterium]